ncbi:MAG: efflux RND transporter periplasmic adaptor subunit [Bryobacteraceae bacterium]|nr:efflux RND transporter periplasmic adaptor subunit [Bryobacteraceae bacterium]
MSTAHLPVPVQNPKLAPVPVPTPPTPPAAAGPVKMWAVWVILLLVIAGLISYLYSRRASARKAASSAAVVVKTATVMPADIRQTMRVTGQTAATTYSSVTAPMMRGPDANREMILMSVAQPGSWVKKGTLVARIDAQSILDHIDDLNDTIETATGDIRKRRAEQSIEMENLLQSLRLAKSDFDKSSLEYKGSETQTDIQRQLLKLNVDEADARYKELQSDVSHKKAAQAAEIRILELTLLRHTRHRDRHKRDAQAFEVHASMDGLVVMQQIWRGNEMGQVQQGDRVSPGQPFMKVVNTSFMQVEGTVNQTESSEFRIGQTARIKLDAFPGLEFDGRVHSIGALANGGWRNSYFVRTVPIRLDIIGKDPRLIPDLSAAADVLIATESAKTVVPLAAVREEDGKAIVQVKSGEGWERRQVVAGLRDSMQVVIASGLRAGEIIRIEE